MNYGICPICAKEVSPHNNFVSLKNGTAIHLSCFFEGVPNSPTKEEHDIAVSRRVEEIIGGMKQQKKWVTVHSFASYNVQILDQAEVGDCMDYRIDPPLKAGGVTYPTIQDADDAIKKHVRTSRNY